MAEKPNFFSDLPEEEDKDESEVQKEETPDRIESKEDEAIRNLEKAKKREEARIAKAKQELEEKRKERKRIEAKIEEPEEDEEVVDEEVKEEKPDIVKATVEATLREREERKRLDDLRGEVRKYAKTRQEAEKMYEEALRLPPDWGNEEIARLSAERVQALKESNRGFVMPSLTGGGFADMASRSTGEEVEGMSKERVKYLKERGWTVEDIKKFKDGPDLGRVFPKVLVNNR